MALKKVRPGSHEPGLLRYDLEVLAVQPLNGDHEVPFGGYILLRRLAVGGMAEIFLARERGAGPEEFIVIKRLLGHISEHPGLVQMFLDEARVAATLRHPNIVNIYNVGTVGGHFFLSMEHLRGLDVSKLNREIRRQKRKLPIQHVLYICHRISQALAYAHNHRGSKGERLDIVHRDLSPHNVFLTLEGDIKLLDFGVAKAANALHKTKTGALIGKLAYMSPEHLNNDVALDSRSDLFSLGIIMWELLVGRRLYNTKKLGEFEVLRRITQEAVPDPSEYRDDCPPVVKEILDRALRKNRDDRFQTAADFGRAIEAAAQSLGCDLIGEGLADFVSSSLPEVVERITSSIRRLERSRISLSPSLQNTPSALVQPDLAPGISQSTPTTGSGHERVPESPRESVGMFEDDEERTERRMRPMQRVSWTQLQRDQKPAPPPPKDRSTVLPVILLGVLLVGVGVGLVVLFGS